MVHAVFLLFQLGGNNFSVWKREHVRPHTIDGMQKYSKTHVPIKVKNVLFVNYALFFANKKTILKASLQYGFAVIMMYIQKLFIKFRGGCQYNSRMAGTDVFHQTL